jgi:hypothetical protein
LKTTQRLEKILSEYEDVLWLLRLLGRSAGEDMSRIPEPQTLRKALEEGDLRASMQVCHNLLMAGPEYKFAFDNGSDLADWCSQSKRIFSISDTLCGMLLATDLPDFSAEGMKWVSQAFVVQLANPISSSNGRNHDFILCSYSPNTKSLSIRSYPADYEDYQPFSEQEKLQVERDARNQNPGFMRFVERFMKKTKSRSVTGYTCFLLSTKSCKENILRDAPADEREDWEILFQLALGVNLYLQSARGNDAEKVTRIRNRGPNRKCHITDGANLFELSTSAALSSKSNGLCSGDETKGDVRPHFRRGYWRRPSGSGSDPTAFATIWVRPTWVRKDKIEDGESPTGSLQRVQGK